MQTFRHRRFHWLDWLPGVLQIGVALVCLSMLFFVPGAAEAAPSFRALAIGVILGALFLGLRAIAYAVTVWRRGKHLQVTPGDATLCITDERRRTHECGWQDLKLASETSKLKVTMPGADGRVAFEIAIGAREFENGHTLVSLIASRYSAAQRLRQERSAPPPGSPSGPYSGVSMIPFPPEEESEHE